MSCLEIQRTERPMIAKGKRQIPLLNETFLREWFSTFLRYIKDMLSKILILDKVNCNWIFTYQAIIWLWNFPREQNLTPKFQKLSTGSNCAFFYWSREETIRLKHPKFQLTEKKIWTGHKFFRENYRDSKQTRTRMTISQWNSISSYEQAESKFGTTFHLLITFNIKIDIQLASSNSNPIENIILTNSYLEGMKMLLTV